MRTPIESFLPKSHRGEWICDSYNALSQRIKTSPAERYRYYRQVIDNSYSEYPLNCRPGDLTIEGMEQHKRNGINYRKYLIDDLHFLPETMDPKLFRFYSSPVERCMKSAESFLAGLYPPFSDNEVLSVETGSPTLSPLMINPNQCPELKALEAEFFNSKEYKSYMESMWAVVEEAARYLNLTKSYSNIHTICQWAIAFNCTDKSRHPSFFSEEMVLRCQEQQAYNQFGFFGQSGKIGIASAAPMRQLIQNADEAIGNGSGVRFVLHSAHDTTVAAILTLLGNVYDQIPPYSSHLAMEIWEDDWKLLYVRFVFNGLPLIPSGFNSSLVRFDDFRSYYSPIINHCNEI